MDKIVPTMMPTPSDTGTNTQKYAEEVSVMWNNSSTKSMMPKISTATRATTTIKPKMIRFVSLLVEDKMCCSSLKDSCRVGCLVVLFVIAHRLVTKTTHGYNFEIFVVGKVGA